MTGGAVCYSPVRLPASLAVATEVAAWRTWFLRPSLVDHNCAAVHLTVIQLVDRLFGGLVVVEFDKPKAFGAVGVAVDDDLS